jgi:DNA-binding NtrC family response regulator
MTASSSNSTGAHPEDGIAAGKSKAMLTPLRQGTVLVFTQNERLSGVVSHAVESLGARSPRLSWVRTLADCLVALRLLTPSLVILDDATIAADGARALQDLLQVRPGTPVIYFASRHTLDLEREVRRLGVLFYVQMPPSPDQLDTMLARILGVFVCDSRGRGSL